MKLTKPQKLIYDMEQFAGGSIAVICGSVLINGRRDESVLKQAVNEIYRLNDALRIRITEDQDGVSQRIGEYHGKESSVLHFENKAQMDDFAGRYAKLPLDLSAELCEFNIVLLPEQYGLLVKLHHMISDAWTLTLIANQFIAILEGKSPDAYSYADYIRTEQEYIGSRRMERDRVFFLKQFEKCNEVTYLSEKQGSSFLSKRKTYVMDGDEAKRITGYAAAHNTSAFMLFTAVLSAYLSRINGYKEKFYIGTAVLNRITQKEKNTVGMFINTVPLLIELDHTKSFAENLSHLQAHVIMEAFRHQKYNYGEVLSDLRSRYGFRERLYDVLISYQNAFVRSGHTSTWYHSGMQTESLQIHIEDYDNEGVFHLHYDYQTDKFTDHDVEMLHRRLMSLLSDAAADDSRRISELNMLTSEEKQQILYTFNDSAADYPCEKCICQLFEEQAAKMPEKPAVMACDRTLTYQELNEDANRIANALQDRGVGRGDIVAFALPRKSCLISTMMGILKSGAAYMPIDPDYPQERIASMLSESGARYLIDNNTIEEFLQSANTKNPGTEIKSDDLFCALHTSGSTGTPKLSLLKHGGMMNFITANKRFWNGVDTVVSATIVTFDAFQMDSVLSVSQGYQLILASEDQIFNQTEFEELFSHSEKNMFFSTPTKIENYIDGSKDKQFLSRIKSFVIGGEVFGETLFGKISDHAPASRVFNIYGPTETTICSAVDVLEQGREITIGKPIANTHIYIVDPFMNLVPVGITGELCIAGDGVGAGYLNHPELTAERFIDNPFGEGRLYKTGDLAYWREDGRIEYVGRNDFQIKIRGLRMEPGEIENALCSIDGISQTVVVVRKDSKGRQLICAFYTGKQLAPKEIRAQIGKKLPKYMHPHIFTHIDEMPLTPSGKINRRALPEIDLNSIPIDTEFIAPTAGREKILCRLLEDVLNTSPIGIADDFFDHGMDSLKAIAFVSEAHSEGIYFNLQNIFDYPSVQALCRCIENSDRQTVSYSDADFGSIHEVLAKNTAEKMSKPEKKEVGNILLAGATGYLGIHILADYLDRDGGIAWCLVRGKNAADSKNRMSNLLDFYFDGKYKKSDRIKVICGDMQKDGLGMPEQEYSALLPHIDTVINCAASVKHYGSYSYFYEANVESTKRLIAFAKAADAKLIHISTLSVSGNAFRDESDGCVNREERQFFEKSLYIGQSLNNVYVHSKFEAEKAVLDAMADGLKANIMRMGNLTNRSSDGVFQYNYESNNFLKHIKAVAELGCVPHSLMGSMSCEFTPVDRAASAVMTIVRHFSTEQTVFHINSEPVRLEKLTEYLNTLGCSIRAVDDNVFTEALHRTAEQAGKEYIYETFIQDMDSHDRVRYGSDVRVSNDFTVKYLKQIGFEWEKTDLQYLRKYVDYFRKIGYLPGQDKGEDGGCRMDGTDGG